MADHNDLGDKGEMLAASYLQDIGYMILEKNWRAGRSEIDIIAKDGEILVFVEVKTRKYHPKADPSLAISPKKAEWMKDGAARYMEKIQHEWAIRFDVISILIDKESHRLQHYKDSFNPWEYG